MPRGRGFNLPFPFLSGWAGLTVPLIDLTDVFDLVDLYNLFDVGEELPLLV